MANILLGVTGSVAAIHTPLLFQELIKAGHAAKIIATRQRLSQGMRALGFDPVPSQSNFVWCPHATVPVKPLYERLKESRVLVRYMNYAGWPDGLRISVGSDEQIDACLGLLKGMV